MPLFVTVFLWLFFAAAANGTLMSVILLRHPQKKQHLLGWLILLLSLSLFTYVFNMFYGRVSWNPGSIVAWMIISLMGPLLLLYTAREYNLPYNKKPALLCLLPTAYLLVQILLFPFLGRKAILLPGAYTAFGTTALLIVYCGISARFYQKYAPNVEVAAGILQYRVKTLKYLLIFTLCFALSLIMYVAALVNNEPDVMYYAMVVKFIMTVGIYFTVYQKLVLANSLQKETPAETPGRKYKTSALRTETQEYIVRRLQKVMQERQLFLQPDIRMKELADELGTSTNYLSQTVNEKMQLSFPDYINALRVNHAKHLICSQENNDLKMQEVYAQSGFANKTTFNKAFKDITGMTPTEYRAKYNVAAS
ncbi:helix-turn-helix domain-containing protein [Chitinophaga barathri]|uniref:AraC family transcriptional regulator n=1 Tax=Chitinophaga barathri TaxID=1647451 RepID=A0A3N4MD09_9BACT|nr:helix-turn-helix domain-containing protein [Chitinophaga barathri]RPD37940.1 AraC family transcriptional regulator [Chitinophaga barathri]